MKGAWQSDWQQAADEAQALRDRIAELEHQLDIRKAAIEAQFRLMARVAELEKALRLAHEVLSGHAMSKSTLERALEAIKACGL